MAETAEIEDVDTEDDYIHVRFEDPDEFETIRTPDWAENAAKSVSDGAEVRTGKRENSDEWETQSVLIKKSVGEEKAREQAAEIVQKIRS